MESGITWRKPGIVASSNQTKSLIDIIESLDAIIDQRGIVIVTAEVSGVVRDIETFA